jgi:hypothetical protein
MEKKREWNRELMRRLEGRESHEVLAPLFELSHRRASEIVRTYSILAVVGLFQELLKKHAIKLAGS